MSYKTYENYKDSGNKFISKMPGHWDLAKFKIFYSYVKGKNPKDFYDEEDEGLVPYLSMDYLRNKSEAEFVSVTDCSVKATDGDILLLWDGSNAGEFVVSKYGAVSSTMAKLIPNISINDSYSKYLCKSIEPLLRELTIGMGVPHVNSNELNNMIIPFIDIAEQVYIANYLDKKTSEIDKNIEKNKELISLLEEKKVALINQVVTKGLDLNVSTKDSGIDWMGNIPKSFDVVPLTKFLKSLVDYRGKTPEKVDEGIFLVTAKNIKQGKINYDLSKEFVKIEDYDEIMSRGKPSVGDVLFTTEAPLGEVANVDDSNIALAQRIIKMCGKNKILNNYYLKYYMMSKTFQNHLQSLATGSTALGIKGNKLFMLKLILPPYNEQLKIVSYLDEETLKIDKTINKIEENIDLLEEYKASLIYHVVTGKVDVRDEV